MSDQDYMQWHLPEGVNARLGKAKSTLIVSTLNYTRREYHRKYQEGLKRCYGTHKYHFNRRTHLFTSL